MTAIEKAKELAKTILRKREGEEILKWARSPLTSTSGTFTTATSVVTGWSLSGSSLSYCPNCSCTHCQYEKRKR